MYFIESVLQDAIEKAIDATTAKINQTPGNLEGELAFKKGEVALLNQLGTTCLSLSISVDDEDNLLKLNHYLEQIHQAFETANDSAKNMALEYAKNPKYTGCVFDGNRMASCFTSQIDAIIRQICADFSKDGGLYHRHAFSPIESFTREGHDKIWLNHFVRGCFNYKVSKLVEIHVLNQDSDIYQKKVENINSTYKEWTNFLSFTQIKALAEKAKAEKTAKLAELEATEEKAQDTTNSLKKVPVKRGKKQRASDIPLETEQEIESLDTPLNHEKEIQTLQNDIAHQQLTIDMCQEQLRAIPYENANSAVLAYLQKCKKEDKTIQSKGADQNQVTKFLNDFLRHHQINRGTFDKFISDFYEKFKAFHESQPISTPPLTA